MERQFYIYVWYRKDNGKPFYVGKGKGNRYRLLFNRNKYFMNVYSKHGGFSEKVIEGLTEQEAIEKEIQLIREYKEKYPLTNITDGGEGVSGLHHSKETRKQLSELARKQWSKKETRERLIKSRKIGHNRPEVREKLSKIHKGKKLTDEHKKKIKRTMNSSDVVNKLAESHTKYTMIECIKENGESLVFYNTKDVVEWMKSLGYEKARMSSIIGCLTGTRKTSFGFKFKLLNEESDD